MTTLAEDREAEFQTYLAMSANYFAAIREAGDLAWFEPGHSRRYVILAQLGLDDDIEEADLRRALFMRRYKETP
ncbi:hypothetical protein R4227_22270 [Gordonia amicalis]|uniref:Uncharacterized protein n=1 Tax=Gordonia amicalis TaxID=89053 RepID=A0ABU4DKJ9_9ACTN|nr:hypothetical protein [Gordonia amicalis]MDV6310265.1 hypothetical protein [Gordonia amicalis]MDV7102745.1 hypothetical protein [Gordonia amicalis]